MDLKGRADNFLELNTPAHRLRTPMSKWYTCAPARFEAETGSSFFTRDSGLLCRGLQDMGYESRVIMLGPAYPADDPDVIRATPDELASPDWWRSLKLDGLIMVAWARHRETPISRAIVESGTPYVLLLDSTGSGYPLLHQWDALKTFWRAQRGTGRGLIARTAAFLTRAILSGISTLIRHSYLRYRHMRIPNVVICPTPSALERQREFCEFFGGKNHGVNLQLAPHPISDVYQWDPSVQKEKRIIAVGRWNDLCFKRPNVLMSVCGEIARRQPCLHIDIFGVTTKAVDDWHASLDSGVRERIHLHGFQPAAVIAKAEQKAQVLFIPSSSEGGPVALFESLACGTTIVGYNSGHLPGIRWAADRHNGGLAEHDTTESYVGALERELAKWERGEYSPQQISEYWRSKANYHAVLQTMLDAAQAARSKQ